MKNLSTNKGFSIIELLVTLSIAGILLTVAVPSFQEFVQESRISAQSNRFLSAMMLAKSEAIKRNSPAIVCPSTDGATCTGGSVWSNGWIVYADTNSNGAPDVGEEIVQVGAAFTGGNTLQSNGNGTSIRFTPNGFSMGSNAIFSLCDKRGAVNSRAIRLNNQGRAMTEKGTGTC